MKILTVKLNVPIYETRGRPASDENIFLWSGPVGSSFFSQKRRQTLYQIARQIGVRVKIVAGEEKGKKGFIIHKLAAPNPDRKGVRKSRNLFPDPVEIS
jgi:hypothetical protein